MVKIQPAPMTYLRTPVYSFDAENGFEPVSVQIPPGPPQSPEFSDPLLPHWRQEDLPIKSEWPRFHGNGYRCPSYRHTLGALRSIVEHAARIHEKDMTVQDFDGVETAGPRRGYLPRLALLDCHRPLGGRDYVEQVFLYGSDIEVMS